MKISTTDIKNLKIIRDNISKFLSSCAKRYGGSGFLLDIAPQIHQGAAPHFVQAKIFTLDINPNSQANYIADICNNNQELIPNNSFDWVVCTEVLEHTLNPFAAVQEIHRILKPNGLLFLSVPFNFRIHGPLPDCWRFTEYGLRVLLKTFEKIRINVIESPKRPLMPIHYTVIARKQLE
jgi:SAM-dependent methyltransferase